LIQFEASQIEAPGSGFVTGKDLFIAGQWIKILSDEAHDQK